jgi:uncharacterized membrane protein YeiB
MAEFLGDIAFMIEVFALSIGLIVLHFNKKEKSVYLSWAGRLLSAFGVLGMVCTGFFYIKYFFAGEFDQTHSMGKPSHSMMEMMGVMQNQNRADENHVIMNPQILKNMRQHMISTVNECMEMVEGKMIDAESKLMIETCFQKKNE